MKKKFETYLKEIKVPSPVIERISHIIEIYAKFSPEEVKDIFVSEFLKEDRERVFENFWLFSDKYAMEAKHFVSSKEDEFDIAFYKDSIRRLEIKKKDSS